MSEFLYNLGDKAKDRITGFTGIIIARTQWLTNCNTYALKYTKLHENKPMDAQWFDEPNIEIVKKKEALEPKKKTGGPTEKVKETNR